jgi:hypothetical protein
MMAPVFSGPGGLGWSSVWLYRSATTAYLAQTAVEDQLRVLSAKEFHAKYRVRRGWLGMRWHTSIVGQDK